MKPNRDLFTQFDEIGSPIAIAPLFMGWIAQCRAWMQNRPRPGQPYRSCASSSTRTRRSPPPLAALPRRALRPVRHDGPGSGHHSLAGHRPSFARAADAIALIGLFATARVFLSLAAMDIGTAFGTLGARREMMVGFLAEPALLMVLFIAFLLFGSTALPSLAKTTRHPPLDLYPSLMFSAVAFIMVLLAENARIPIDNPSTHLELTMIHEAMVLEYSARHLALIEWARRAEALQLRLHRLRAVHPLGHRHPRRRTACACYFHRRADGQLVVAGAALALIESLSAKLRIFRAPEYLAMAFLLAVLGLLVHLLLGA